ncbi:AAA family ATPase [Pseudomonas huaxiensis]|uniref:AAA family ATPase n=1 Tax=Pseudomonas huaxiensis TaxID=2213017 RepID=UPI000DA691C5|nr:AAA family ATPase [Pseudomonas huaxiensis]
MKILAIRLKNLASLAGPFEIDFTAEPLASAGLFAITGPTGAGKSTLLDALCLALFGSVPRLDNIGRETKVPDIDGEILTNDPRTLLRRGTGSGFAEVDFVGIDGRHYRARWETNRARDKATGKLQGSRQSLHDLDSQQLLSNQSKREYEQLIESRLGLNFAQFTRAVMLAQSEFSAFLKADDKERSELLEKLTNTAIYSQLGRRAFIKAKDASDSYKALELEASGVLPMNAEERAALDERLGDAQQQLKAEQAQLRQLEQQRTWLNELHAMQAQQSAAAADLSSARQAWEQLAGERLNLTRLEQLAPQRHQFARRQELLNQLTPLASALEQQRRQQTELGSRQQQLDQDLNGAREALTRALGEQTDSAPRLRQAFDTQHNLARLEQELTRDRALTLQAQQACEEGRSQLASLIEHQQRHEQTLASIAGQLEQSAALASLGSAWNAYRSQLQQVMLTANRLGKGREELPTLRQTAETRARQCEELRAELAVLFQEAGAEPQALAEQIGLLGTLLQDNRKLQRGFEELARLWGRQQDVEQRLLALRERQSGAQQERAQLIAAGLQGKQELEAAQQALTLTRQLLERQRLARNASVEELRTQLQDEQPCPVCGSLDHPYHQPEALLENLARHDESEEANAQKAVTELTQKLDELRSQLGGVNGQLKEYLHQQEQLNTQLQGLAPELEAQPLYPQLAEQNSASRSQWLDLQLRRLNDDIARDEQRQNALLTLQQDAARLQQQLQAANDASQQATQQLNQQQDALHADEQRLQQELAHFEPLLPADIFAALRDKPAETFLTLDQQLNTRQQLLDQQKDEQQELNERIKQREALELKQQARQQEQDKLQQQLVASETQQQQAREALTALIGEHADAESWQRHLEQAVEQARNAEAAVNQQLQEARTQAAAIASELKAREEQHAHLEQEKQQLDAAIAQWRQAHPELDEQGLDALLGMDDEQVASLRQRLQAAEKAIEQAGVRVQERDERLQQHQALNLTEQPPEALELALQGSQQQLDQHEHHCAELRAQQAEDQRRQHASQALAERIAQARGEWQRWARLSELIGSASGDTFRKIAQGYNLDLLVHHANQQLRQLVRRYRLKRGGSQLGLLVQDTEMGDELRSVHSLSGGETFLVSLALALGLASMASSTLRIESLFIDEGFGSLDPESLQLAMDALDGLQAQGRKVGVISHVQEMHERIGVQIQVRRQGNGLSTLEVDG